MRKISKTRSTAARGAMDADLRGNRPLRVPGATITSWRGPPDIDLNAIFSRPASGVTVAGAGAGQDDHNLRSMAECRTPGTVSLSDGTTITFATAVQSDTV